MDEIFGDDIKLKEDFYEAYFNAPDTSFTLQVKEWLKEAMKYV